MCPSAGHPVCSLSNPADWDPGNAGTLVAVRTSLSHAAPEAQAPLQHKRVRSNTIDARGTHTKQITNDAQVREKWVHQQHCHPRRQLDSTSSPSSWSCWLAVVRLDSAIVLQFAGWQRACVCACVGL